MDEKQFPPTIYEDEENNENLPRTLNKNDTPNRYEKHANQIESTL